MNEEVVIRGSWVCLMSLRSQSEQVNWTETKSERRGEVTNLFCFIFSSTRTGGKIKLDNMQITVTSLRWRRQPVWMISRLPEECCFELFFARSEKSQPAPLKSSASCEKSKVFQRAFPRELFFSECHLPVLDSWFVSLIWRSLFFLLSGIFVWWGTFFREWVTPERVLERSKCWICPPTDGWPQVFGFWISWLVGGVWFVWRGNLIVFNNPEWWERGLFWERNESENLLILLFEEGNSKNCWHFIYKLYFSVTSLPAE